MERIVYLMATGIVSNTGVRKRTIHNARSSVVRLAVCICALAALLCPSASTQGASRLDFGGGYSQLSPDAADSDDLDGWGLIVRGWFSIGRSDSALRAFIGFRTANYMGDAYETAIWSVWMVTPEIGLTLHLGAETPGSSSSRQLRLACPWRRIADVSGC